MSQDALLERTTGGVKVEIIHEDDALLLFVSKGSLDDEPATQWALIPPDRALDAFEHPAVYLEDPLAVFK